MILRISSLNLFLDCSAKFYFQIIEKVDVPKSIALALGTSVHKALETNYSQKVDSRKDLELETVKDVFSDTYEKETQEVDSNDFKLQSKGDKKDIALLLVEKYHSDIAPHIQPIKVEQRINVKFSNGVELTGQLDLLDEDNVLVDHKTTSRKPTGASISNILQVTGYSILGQTAGYEIKERRIDYLVFGARPEIKHFNVEADRNYFLNVLEVITKSIEAGIFIPNRGSMFCTKRFCKFYNECEKKYGGKVRE